MNVQEQVPGVGTSAGPAWTVSGGHTLLAWKGESSDTRIFWATTSALDPDAHSGQYTWSAQHAVPGVGTSHGPALATFKDAVYMAWKGAGNDLAIYYSTLRADGTWTPKEVVPGVGGTSDGPALAASGDTLYLAWKAQPGDERIFWSKSTNGKTWSPQQPLPNVGGTSAGPALVATIHGIYLAWKAQPGDERIFWSKCLDGKTWSPQQLVPGPTTSLGPALAADPVGNLFLAWRADNHNILFSTLLTPWVNSPLTWSAPTVRFGVSTTDRPAFLGTTLPLKGVAPLMLAWKGVTGDASIWYGPMSLPPVEFNFDLPLFTILNMRSGSLFGKTESDTDYVSLGIKVGSQPAQTITKFVGDQTGGDVTVGLSFPKVKVADTDLVIIHYAIVNSSQGAASANGLLENIGAQLLNAAWKAGETAVESLGADLASIAADAAGELIATALGAEIGTDIVPIIGTALGALAGWIMGDVFKYFWPDCDGPVAAGVHIYKGETLRSSPVVIQTDDNPGVNSPGGCGSNSHYQVTWSIGRQGP